MFESLAESMTSLLCELLLKKAAGNIEDKLDRKQLTNKIREQITRYENEILPGLAGAEQFDFAGANRYIAEHLFDKITFLDRIKSVKMKVKIERCEMMKINEWLAKADEVIQDKTIREMFKKCFMSTLETSIRITNGRTYIITGDINATDNLSKAFGLAEIFRLNLSRIASEIDRSFTKRSISGAISSS